MNWIYIFPLAISISILFYQDLKYRLVSLIWLILFGGSCILVNLLLEGLNIKMVLVNLSFLYLNYGVMWIFYRLKTNQNVKLINSKIGLGDVLMLAFCTSLFSPVNYILFLLGTCTIGLFSQFIPLKKKEGIPLVSAISFILFILLTLSFPDFEISTWKNDYWIVNSLI